MFREIICNKKVRMGKTNIKTDEELGMVGASPEKVKDSRKKLKEESLTEREKGQDSSITKEIANKLGLAFVDLTDFKISPTTLNLIPNDIANELRTIAYLNVGQKVRVATDQTESITQIEKRLNTLLDSQDIKAQLVLASTDSIDQALAQYQTPRKDRSDGDKKERKAKKISSDQSDEIPAEKKLKKIQKADLVNLNQSTLKEIESKLGQVPTTELFKTILEEAVANRASDIHINPQESGARLRYRIDGVLQNVAVLGQEDYDKILSRVKYHGKIKFNISQKPQDGRFSMEIGGKNIDIRLSSFPSVYGESIVMRLLEREKKFYQLDQLGFNQEILEKIKSAISKPNGMILNTGPTGSGKTTTLYAILESLNKPSVKIITLEDPVEYHLKGITQTQIDPEHDFPFKIGLKHALRQDPDIIMVGEIRDKETAATALHSSLTGHLMLTTFHTNNAASAFVRLLDMNLKPFLLIGSVNIIIAQRLVRKLCPNCKKEIKPNSDQIKTLKHLAEDKSIKVNKIYKKSGCPKCNTTGYKERTAIGEAITPNKKLERAILDRPTESEIKSIAKEEDIKTMAQNGVDKVLDGTTSLEELLRVVV